MYDPVQDTQKNRAKEEPGSIGAFREQLRPIFERVKALWPAIPVSERSSQLDWMWAEIYFLMGEDSAGRTLMRESASLNREPNSTAIPGALPDAEASFRLQARQILAIKQVILGDFDGAKQAYTDVPPTTWLEALEAQVSDRRQKRDLRGAIDACRKMRALAQSLPIEYTSTGKDFTQKANQHLVEIARNQARAGDFAAAIDCCRAVSDPESRDNTYLEIAQLQAGKGNFTGALQTAAAIENGEKQVTLLLEIARAQGKTERLKAVATLRRAEAKADTLNRPNRYFALIGVGLSQKRQGDTVRADATRKRARKFLPETLQAAHAASRLSERVEALLRIAIYQGADGDTVGAVRTGREAEKIVDTIPNDGERLFYGGAVAVARAVAGDREGAAQSLEHLRVWTGRFAPSALLKNPTSNYRVEPPDREPLDIQFGNLIGGDPRTGQMEKDTTAYPRSMITQVERAILWEGARRGNTSAALRGVSAQSTSERPTYLHEIARIQIGRGDLAGARATLTQAFVTVRAHTENAWVNVTILYDIQQAQIQARDVAGARATGVHLQNLVQTTGSVMDRLQSCVALAWQQFENGDREATERTFATAFNLPEQASSPSEKSAMYHTLISTIYTFSRAFSGSKSAFYWERMQTWTERIPNPEIRLSVYMLFMSDVQSRGREYLRVARKAFDLLPDLASKSNWRPQLALHWIRFGDARQVLPLADDLPETRDKVQFLISTVQTAFR